jgi:hypothetical protein
MKKMLDDNDKPELTVTVQVAIDEGIFINFLKELGYQYSFDKDGSFTLAWKWLRKHCVLDDWNYLKFEDLSEKAVEQFKEYYSNHAIPGSSITCGVQIDGYNQFARWGKWKGGYVQELGYISAPSSSSYGASIYMGSSFIPQGGNDTPLYECRFYAIQEHNTWQGGYVDGWGYVSPEKKILGATISDWFITGSTSDKALLNLLNFRLFADSNPAAYSDLSALQQEFAQCWDANTQSYEIDDVRLLQYLQSQYGSHQVAVTNIREALSQHRAVFLRVVTRVVSSAGVDKRYGNDYVLLYYNALMRTYGYIDPVSGKVSEIDAVPVDNGNADIIVFACERRTN